MGIKTLFGANLKQYRKEKRLSQEELSEKIGISVNHLSRIERGLTFVSADLLERIAGSLDVTAAVLFCTANEKIFTGTLLHIVDRITEKHLIRAMEGIKADFRQGDNGLKTAKEGGF